MIYKLIKNSLGHTVISKINIDGSGNSFIEDINNTDYQAYLKWVDEGGIPEPADE